MYGKNGLSHSPQIRHPYSNRSTTIQQQSPPIINGSDNRNQYSSSAQQQQSSAPALHQMYSPTQAHPSAVNHAAVSNFF